MTVDPRCAAGQYDGRWTQSDVGGMRPAQNPLRRVHVLRSAQARTGSDYFAGYRADLVDLRHFFGI
jgi:hypothetical protein